MAQKWIHGQVMARNQHYDDWVLQQQLNNICLIFSNIIYLVAT
jgi:hypothetical protein